MVIIIHCQRRPEDERNENLLEDLKIIRLKRPTKWNGIGSSAHAEGLSDGCDVRVRRAAYVS